VVPPVAEAVNVTDVPVVPVVGPLIDAVSAKPPHVTDAEAVAVFALPSVAVTVMVSVPLMVQVVVKLEPVPVDGLAPGALQLNVYGEVPPVAEAVKVIGVPTVPVVGPLTVAARASGLTVIVADAVWVL
jgi:hypothetical protein